MWLSAAIVVYRYRVHHQSGLLIKGGCCARGSDRHGALAATEAELRIHEAAVRRNLLAFAGRYKAACRRVYRPVALPQYRSSSPVREDSVSAEGSRALGCDEAGCEKLWRFAT